VGKPEDSRQHDRHYPISRIGEPDEIAGCIAPLASAAARYMTGQAIVSDGGSTIFSTSNE
jgi:NAD(P)-dependent dehydrogenase (short-subunit alcohol dehydrogenase family)